MEADERVLVVRFDVKKNQAGDKAQQVGQRRDYVGLRFTGFTVHRDFLLKALGSRSERSRNLICNRTGRGIAMRSHAARVLHRKSDYCERLFTASSRSIAAVALRAVSTTSSCARTRLASWRRNTGLARKSLTPRRIPSARASRSSRAVIMIIGISAVTGLALSSLTTWKPSISGIIRSSRITSTS